MSIRSIIEDARAIAARGIASGLLNHRRAGRERTKEQALANARATVARLEQRGLVKVAADNPDATEAELRARRRRYKRHWNRRYRERLYARRGKRPMVSRGEFPDTEEGYREYQRAYRKAWYAVPANRERQLRAVRAWHAVRSTRKERTR